jgi:hypothetical protein
MPPFQTAPAIPLPRWEGIKGRVTDLKSDADSHIRGNDSIAVFCCRCDKLFSLDTEIKSVEKRKEMGIS